MKDINPQEAKSLVDRLGPHIRYDFTYEPFFPKTRKDVCAVRRLAEDGSSYGYDTIYLIWKSGDILFHRVIADSSDTKDYISIDDVFEDEKDIVVKYGSGGSYSGSAWKREYRQSKKSLGLK
jgi:hypothetical protein